MSEDPHKGGNSKVASGQMAMSKRELEVLQLLADGLSNDEIGDRLSISTHTVAMHIKGARIRLGARTREQAVALGIELGLIQVNRIPRT